jgi:hypothetical protein
MHDAGKVLADLVDHAAHHSALKCSTVGPVLERPRSDVSTLLASVAAFSIPARRVSRRPTTKATPNAAISTTMTRTQEELMTV